MKNVTETSSRKEQLMFAKSELNVLIEERESEVYKDEFNPFIENDIKELDELIANLKLEISILEK